MSIDKYKELVMIAYEHHQAATVFVLPVARLVDQSTSATVHASMQLHAQYSTY
jgi:hypothetical protein